MTMLFLFTDRDQGQVRNRKGSARSLTASCAAVMLRQDWTMNGIKRERWTEADVLVLPTGEHDFFDRKSGSLMGTVDFRKDMAKAISAFANSGGGHLLLGVKDDGTFDGVPPVAKGRMPTRQWLEQIIPNLVNFPLEDFRVHEVMPATPSSIPAGKVVIVADVGDSVLAPHQAADARIYYYREGGHSKPAPHFYLETLRNRLVNPVLKAELEGLTISRAYRHDGGVFVETRLRFRLTNTGRIASYKWALVIEHMKDWDAERADDYRFIFQSFPRGNEGRSSSIRVDTTILPSLWMDEEKDFGFFLRPESNDGAGIAKDLSALFRPGFTLGFRAVSETSRGVTVEEPLSKVLEPNTFADMILSALK
jgi:hypothetical protein